MSEQAEWADWAKGEIDRLRQRAERFERILAANAKFPLAASMILAAVAAAEQEVGRE